MSGPFPQTDQGNRYLVIAMDYCTPRPKVYANPNKEAPTVEEYLESFTATKDGTWGLT
jgi:hypothetical protein